MTPDVSIVVVSKDSAADLPVSLAAAAAQRGVGSEIVVVDNASADGSREAAAAFGTAVRVVALPTNAGFAAAMNEGIAATAGRYVLALNPDCRLEPDFAAVLARRLDAPDAGDVGSASGRLYRAEGRDLARTDRLDSAGIRFTASGRHFDRGSGELAAGRYEAGRRRSPGRAAPRVSTAGRRSRTRASRRASSTRTSSSTARTRTSPGACGGSAGAVSTCPRRWRRTAASTRRNGAGACRRSRTCIR